MMKVHVIGAGIGGLCTALGMRRIGCEVLISERADGLREVGAGISLWRNALQGLDALGAGGAIRSSAVPARVVEFRVNEGHRCIARMDLATHEYNKGLEPTINMVHRADLVGTLAKHLPATIFRWKQNLVGIESTDEQVTAVFQDGTRVMSDLLIGADGIHSETRRYVLGACRPRYAGYTCYRGVCEAKANLVSTGYCSEIWGRGMRFGVASIPRGRVYWWFVRTAPPNEAEKDPRDRLRKLLKDWASPVPQLLKLTAPEAIIKNDILDHEPRLPWHRGRAGLLGDSAHAVTPNFGQGGCLAIEDAVVLCRQMRGAMVRHGTATSFTADINTVERIFSAYESERFKRCSWLCKKSNQLGNLGQWSSGWAVALRNFAFGATPTSYVWRSLFKPMGYDVGTL